MQLWRFVACSVVLVLGPGLVTPAQATQDLNLARDQYGDAVIAINRGQWTEYEQLRNDLDGYPLSIYIDYFRLSGKPSRVRPSDARQFVTMSEGSPLPNRFLSVYLNRAGRDRRWADFLEVMPEEPNSIVLKCYYFRALLAGGDQLAAWEGAERLWVHGDSRPKECDPLFNAWLKAGQVSDEVVWARLLKAFDARKKSLMSYVARKGSDQLKPWSDTLLAVYSKPSTLKRHRLPADQPYSADIATHGLAYLARYSPAKALEYWQDYQGNLSFSQDQAHKVEYAIALHGLFARTEENLTWLDGALERLGEDKLVEIRLRWLLEEQDWNSVLENLPRLTEAGRDKTGWQYWRARAMEQTGEAAAAKPLMAALAEERDYYGFLAADHLGRDYAFNHQSFALESSGHEPLLAMPAVQRVEELHFHEEQQLAHSEWHYVLMDSDSQRQQQLAVLAADQGWHRMAIDAAAKAKAWDALDLRFPMPYQETFAHFGAVQRVPHTELMAIARRESAFYPEARSPVGARGLMQIMPATGKQVASQLGRKHSNSALYDVEHNVLLGSAYYRQLLDRFDGNRIFALAAYNAGPHRVDRWRRKSAGSVPVEVWVETIPYRETRNYVQAVLSYNVVFQYLQGDNRSMLTAAERQASY